MFKVYRKKALEQCKEYEETKVCEAMIRKKEEEEGEEIWGANGGLYREKVACVVGSFFFNIIFVLIKNLISYVLSCNAMTKWNLYNDYYKV